MPRPNRILVADVPLHITQRGNYGQRVFFRAKTAASTWPCWPVSPALRRLAAGLLSHVQSRPLGRYAPQRQGIIPRSSTHSKRLFARHPCAVAPDGSTSWQARFYLTAMDEEHFWAAMLYVEQNPVRAGLAERAELWRWSSASAHCGGRCDTLLDLVRWRARFDAGENGVRDQNSGFPLTRCLC